MRVATLDKTGRSQAVSECSDAIGKWTRRSNSEIADYGHRRSSRLRVCGERPHSRSGDGNDELAPFHDSPHQVLEVLSYRSSANATGHSICNMILKVAVLEAGHGP
jgi:hypothetical protein